MAAENRDKVYSNLTFNRELQIHLFTGIIYMWSRLMDHAMKIGIETWRCFFFTFFLFSWTQGKRESSKNKESSCQYRKVSLNVRRTFYSGTRQAFQLVHATSTAGRTSGKPYILKARLHMRFLMRFLMRFRVQNAPYPTLHECFFREASCGLERKSSHIVWRHSSFQFLLTWWYFVAALRD